MFITAAALSIVASCSWNNPGADPYMGSVPDAVHSYTDIPQPIRDRLHSRMQRRDYDDIVLINAETIVGAHVYGGLRQMHFGSNRRCEEVDMSKWVGKAERGLVYCEAEHCIIVPTVCRNVSRVTKIMETPKHHDILERNFRTEEEARLRELLKREEERKKKAIQTVPEPSSLMLVVGGLLAAVGIRRKNK